jgi:hypothetical protein
VNTYRDGVSLMTGKGVQKVKEHIALQFEKARNSGATSLVPWKPKRELRTLMTEDADESCAAHTSMRLALIPESKPLRPLAERVAPLLRQIHVPVSLHRRKNVGEGWVVEIPKEQAEELFEAALAALGYPSEKSCEPSLRTCLKAEPKKSSIWKRHARTL